MNIKDSGLKRQSHISLPLWLIFLLTCMIVGILYAAFKGVAFSGYPKLTDLIVDVIAIEGSNKTGEWNFFWLLTWGGCLLCLFFFLIKSLLFDKQISKPPLSEAGTAFPHAVFCLVIFLPAAVMTILYADSVLYLWLFSGVFYIIAVFFKEHVKEYAALYLFLYFDLQSAVVVLSILHIADFLFDLILFLIPTSAFFLLLIFNRKQKALTEERINKLFGILQLPLPLLMLLYLKNTYSWQEHTLVLQVPFGYLVFILLIIIGMYVFGILSYRKKNPITVSSVLAIFLYGSYIPAALIVPTDLHHYGEQILPYQQIAEFSMSAYEEYSPVSGLYPMVMGFINSLFFQNKASTFYAACSVTVILFSVIIFYLICKHIEPSQALLFAFLFHMPVYCRTYMILPVLLIWILPKAVKNKQSFLYIYIFCGFLSGLYYPLFGLALICGGMPFAIAEFILLIKEFRRKNSPKKILDKKVIIILPIIISIPMLIRMAKHIFAYSGQSLLADGISLSSCNVPDWFIPYLSASQSLQHIRSFLYYAVRFLVPMAVIWIALLLLCSFIHKNYTKDDPFRLFTSPVFLGLSAAFLILPVSYSYTIVIMNEGWIGRLFSRSGHVWLWIFGMFLPILLFCRGKEIMNSQRSIYAMISLCITIGMVSFSNMKDYHYALTESVTNGESSVVGQYTDNLKPFALPDNLVPISEFDQASFNRLGNGFIDKNTLESLYHFQNNLAILRLADADMRILGLDKQMYYFLLDEPCFYSGKPSLAKGYDAAKTVFPFLDAHTAVGNDISSLQNYYIYREMMIRGYAYDPLTQFYLPKELFISLYGEASYNNADRRHTPYSQDTYLSRMPSVLFENISNLSELLTRSDEPADFLAVVIDRKTLETVLDISVTKESIFRIDFIPEEDSGEICHYFLTDYETGSWLLPLGTNEYYMFSHPDKIYISLFSQDEINASEKVPLKDVCEQYQYYSAK